MNDEILDRIAALGKCPSLDLAVNLHLGRLTVKGTARLTVCVAPPADQVRTVTFTRSPSNPGDSPMAAAKGHIALQDQDPGLQVTSRPCDVVLGTGVTTRVDMIDPNATFDINEGDTYTVTPAGSVNAQGTGPAGSPFSGTCTLGGGGGGLPAAEVVTGVSFTAA